MLHAITFIESLSEILSACFCEGVGFLQIIRDLFDKSRDLVVISLSPLHTTISIGDEEVVLGSGDSNIGESAFFFQ